MKTNKIFPELIRILVAVILLLLVAINDDFLAKATAGEVGVVVRGSFSADAPAGMMGFTAIAAGFSHPRSAAGER